MENKTIIPKEEKRGISLFKQLAQKKREVRAHLADGGNLADLQGKNHSFVQPV